MKTKAIKLTKEEKEILAAYNKGTMKLSTPSKREKTKLKTIANKTLSLKSGKPL